MTAVACTFLVCGTLLTGFLFWLYRQPKVTAAEFADMKQALAKVQQSVSAQAASRIGR